MKAILEISENSVLLKTEINGKQKIKFISPTDLVSVMSKRKALNTGKLPANCYAFEAAGSKKIIFLWYPAQTYSFRLSPKESVKSYPVPSVFLKFTYSNNILSGTNLWATLDSFRTEYNPSLYYFPYGNVFSDSGVCWGNVPIRKEYSSRNITRNIELLFSSTYNDDLGRNIAEHSYGNNSNEALDFLKTLAGKTVFPMNQFARHLYLHEVSSGLY